MLFSLVASKIKRGMTNQLFHITSWMSSHWVKLVNLNRCVTHMWKSVACKDWGAQRFCPVFHTRWVIMFPLCSPCPELSDLGCSKYPPEILLWRHKLKFITLSSFGTLNIKIHIQLHLPSTKYYSLLHSSFPAYQYKCFFIWTQAMR